MTVREQAYQDYLDGKKYKEIADKYNVSLSAVKTWAARYWKKNKKVATETTKSQPKNKRSHPTPTAKKKRKRAPNNGAPLGNTNALKHGGYSKIYWDTLSAEEQELIDTTPKTEEELLIDQIKLLTVRERRLMHIIHGLKDAKGGLSISNIISSSKKRKFANEEEKAKYDEMVQEKIDEGKISYVGTEVFTQTTTESVNSAILRLEQELTSVQAKKTKCILALASIHASKTSSNDMEIVDEWIAAVEAAEGAE